MRITELLGNGDVHLHFYIFPRVKDDMPIKGPVWWTPKEEMYHEKFKVSGEELESLKEKLKNELIRLLTQNYINLLYYKYILFIIFTYSNIFKFIIINKN